MKLEKVELVLVNRKLDIDYTDGTILIDKMKEDQNFKSIPVMLVSNYPEYQEEAVSKGALWGIGKQDYHKDESVEKFKDVLEKIPS